jgi:hypothetical protein
MTSSTPSPNADADEVRDLLLWARSESIVVNVITVGSVTLQLQDLRVLPAAPSVSKDDLSQGSQNLYRQFGGKLLEDMEQHAEAAGVIEDDE